MQCEHLLPSAANGCSFPAFIWAPRGVARADAGVCVLLHGRGAADEPLTFASLRNRYPYVEAMQAAADATGDLVCVPLLGSFAHLDSPIRPEIRRATFVGRELPDILIRDHGVRPDRLRWSLAGFSMGGTAAVNLWARFPDVYAVACNYGGNCNPAFYPQVLGRPAPAEDVLGPYSEFPERFRVWSNDHALGLLEGRRDVALALGCGREDPRLAPIRAQRDRVLAAGVPCTYAEYPGGHVYDFSHVLLQLAAIACLRTVLRASAASAS